MTITEFASILISISSALLIWLTLREMRFQRIKHYEPVLMPINFQFHFHSFYPRKYLPIERCYLPDAIFQRDNQGVNYIPIRNVGQAIATDINFTLKWNRNIKEEFLKSISQLTKLGLMLECDVSDSGIFQNANKLQNIFSGGNYPFDQSVNAMTDYLLPVFASNEDLKIEFSPGIEKLIEFLILEIEMTDVDEQIKAIYQRMKDFLNASILIKYQDNLGNTFSTKCTISLENLSAIVKHDISGKIHILKFKVQRN